VAKYTSPLCKRQSPRRPGFLEPPTTMTLSADVTRLRVTLQAYTGTCGYCGQPPGCLDRGSRQRACLWKSTATRTLAAHGSEGATPVAAKRDRHSRTASHCCCGSHGSPRALENGSGEQVHVDRRHGEGVLPGQAHSGARGRAAPSRRQAWPRNRLSPLSTEKLVYAGLTFQSSTRFQQLWTILWTDTTFSLQTASHRVRAKGSNP
jgi:hypothetical protein